MDEDNKPTSEFGWHEYTDEDDIPDLGEEAGRDTWAGILLEQDEWCKAMVVRDDMGNMVARFRYDDGHEEIFDLLIRRELVNPPIVVIEEDDTPEDEQN